MHSLLADMLLLAIAAAAVGAWYAGAGPARALTAANLALEAEAETAGGWRTSCGRPKSSKPSVTWPAGWPTTSTTSSW
jgi:hypothetical protein